MVEAVLLQRRVGFRHDVLVLDRDRRDLDVEEARRPLRMVARGRHHMLCRDLHPLLGGDEVAAALDHLGQRDDPGRAGPAERVGLPAPLDRDAAVAGTTSQSLGDVGGIDVAVGGVEDRADEVLGPDQRPALLDLVGRHPLVGNVDVLRRGGVEHVFVHPRLALRHPQVADDREAGVQPRLLLQRLVEPDGVVMDVRRRVAHVEVGQQARGVPGGARGQLVPLHQHEVGPAGLCQRVGDAGAHGAAAHDQNSHMGLHSALRHDGISIARSSHRVTGIDDASVAETDIRPPDGYRREARNSRRPPACEM